MRRPIALALAGLMLCGCTSRASETSSSQAQTAPPALSAPAELRNADYSGDDLTPRAITDAQGREVIPDPEGTPVYEDEYVTITYNGTDVTSLTASHDRWYEFRFTATNKSDKEIFLDGIGAVNNSSVDIYSHTVLEPGESSDSVGAMVSWIYDLAPVTDRLSSFSIAFTLETYEYEHEDDLFGDWTFRTATSPITLDFGGEYVTYRHGGDLLFEGDGVTIRYLGSRIEDDELKQVLFVTNDTDELVFVDFDGTYGATGERVPGGVSASLLPHTTQLAEGFFWDPDLFDLKEAMTEEEITQYLTEHLSGLEGAASVTIGADPDTCIQRTTDRMALD